MNVEIGAEAAQFPEKEYINGIAFAVHFIHSPALIIQMYTLFYDLTTITSTYF